MAIQIIEERPEKSTAQKFGQAFANVGQGIAQGIPEYLVGREKQQKLAQDKQARIDYGKELAQLYPNSPSHQMFAQMLQSNMTDEQIDKMSKPLFNNNPYRDMQQRRLERESHINYWKTKINDARKRWEKSWKQEEKNEIEEQINAYQQEMDKIYNEARYNDPDHYFEIKYPKGREEEEVEEERVQLDLNNPEHKAKVDALKKKYGSDVEKITEILKREFIIND